MNRKKQLAVTLMGALAVQTIGAVSPGQGRYLPSPRSYVAIYTLWGILGLLAELGERAGQWAARLSMLVLLTGAVLGPFGTKANSFLELIGRKFAIEPPAGAGGPAEPTEGVTV